MWYAHNATRYFHDIYIEDEYLEVSFTLLYNSLGFLLQQAQNILLFRTEEMRIFDNFVCTITTDIHAVRKSVI